MNFPWKKKVTTEYKKIVNGNFSNIDAKFDIKNDKVYIIIPKIEFDSEIEVGPMEIKISMEDAKKMADKIYKYLEDKK